MGRRFLYILLVAVFAPQVIYADGTPPSPEPPVMLVVGRSTIVDVGKPIARVSLTSADVADAMVTAPSELLINGKTPGTISMFVWDRGGALRRYEVTVQRDVAKLADQMRQIFPNERIGIESNGRGVVLSGSVSTKDVADKAISLAGGYVDKKDDVINLLQIAEGGASNQVLLRVRFAEVSRNAMTELAASFFTGAAGRKDYMGRLTTEQFPAPNFDNSDPTKPKLVFSDFLNFFLFNTKEQVGVVIKALQSKGLFESLAEPNLVAESGKEASFLAGGEFPIPIAQPSGGGTAITVEFKEFGIRLNFTPTVNGNRVHLKVRPEVSSLDFNNAIVLNGFRIPALTTRRTETELELQDHQTFAIAGLINNTMLSTMQKVPGIGDIPILGLLFRSKAAQKDQTELVVMITPEILRTNSVGVTDQLPRLVEPFLDRLPEKKTHPMPPAGFVPPEGALAPKAPAAAPRADAAPASQPVVSAPDPAAAAAAVRALAPRAPQMMTPPPPATPAVKSSTPTPTATPAAATRPLTPEEKKALERARAQEAREKKAAEQAKAIEGQRVARQLEAERKAAAEQKAHEEKLAKEQAKKDAEAKKLADKAAKKAAEDAKRQAEQDKVQQKQINEAAARLKAAQTAYEAELAKKQPK